MKTKTTIKPRTFAPLRLIVIAIVLLAAALLIYRMAFRRPPQNTDNQTVLTPTPPQLSSAIPSGWTFANPSTDSGLKIVKDSQEKIKPTIILIKSAYTDDISEVKYTDKIIKGARSALPSLKFSSDKSENIGSFYLRRLQGTYSNARNLVRIQQRVYIQNKTVYTLSASYLSSDLDTEISTIFDSIFTEKISN